MTVSRQSSGFFSILNGARGRLENAMKSETLSGYCEISGVMLNCINDPTPAP